MIKQMETVLNYKKDIGRSFGLTALLAILIILLCLWITSFITSLFFKIMLYLFAFSCFVILLMSIVRVSRRLGGKPAVRINSEGLFIHNSLSGKWKKIEWGDIVKIDYPDNMELRQRLSYMKIQLHNQVFSLPIALINISYDDLYKQLMLQLKDTNDNNLTV